VGAEAPRVWTQARPAREERAWPNRRVADVGRPARTRAMPTRKRTDHAGSRCHADRDRNVTPKRTNDSPRLTHSLSGEVPVSQPKLATETDDPAFNKVWAAKRQVNRAAKRQCEECFDGHQKFRDASGCNAVGPIYESSYDLATGWVLKNSKRFSAMTAS